MGGFSVKVLNIPDRELMHNYSMFVRALTLLDYEALAKKSDKNSSSMHVMVIRNFGRRYVPKFSPKCFSLTEEYTGKNYIISSDFSKVNFKIIDKRLKKVRIISEVLNFVYISKKTGKITVMLNETLAYSNFRGLLKDVKEVGRMLMFYTYLHTTVDKY